MGVKNSAWRLWNSLMRGRNNDHLHFAFCISLHCHNIRSLNNNLNIQCNLLLMCRQYLLCNLEKEHPVPDSGWWPDALFVFVMHPLVFADCIMYKIIHLPSPSSTFPLHVRNKEWVYDKSQWETDPHFGGCQVLCLTQLPIWLGQTLSGVFHWGE